MADDYDGNYMVLGRSIVQRSIESCLFSQLLIHFIVSNIGSATFLK